MVIQWLLLFSFSTMFKERTSTMNDYRGSAMNNYTMVLVIFSAMFLKNEPLGYYMNDYRGSAI